MPFKEFPVSLPPSCVRAVIAGRKTQLREVVESTGVSEPLTLETCPLGRTGDLLWVREYWNTQPPIADPEEELVPLPSHEIQLIYKGDHDRDLVTEHGKAMWLHPRMMPRWASRVTLRVIDVRLEQLQQISDGDLEREGRMWHDDRNHAESEREGFARWWNIVHPKTHAKWEADPKVWTVNFAVLR
jgi:hypothetical protein